MGRKSTKESKNIYQISRENMGYTRERASELLQFISADRIEKIESEKTQPQPNEIFAMAKCYKTPNLCNYYCSQKCTIGQHYVPEIQLKDLSQIVLEILASLNSIDRQKNRLIEITADGEITDDELTDFIIIEKELEHIASTVDSLQLWIEKTIINEKLDQSKLQAIRENLR